MQQLRRHCLLQAEAVPLLLQTVQQAGQRQPDPRQLPVLSAAQPQKLQKTLALQPQLPLAAAVALCLRQQAAPLLALQARLLRQHPPLQRLLLLPVHPCWQCAAAPACHHQPYHQVQPHQRHAPDHAAAAAAVGAVGVEAA